MIVIKSVEVLESERDVMQTQELCYDPRTFEIPFFDHKVEDVKVVRELIKGRRFVHPERRIDVVIGMSSKVGEILGLQYEAFESMQNSIATLQETNSAIFDEIEEIRSFGFWKRLKCLFTGINMNSTG